MLRFALAENAIAGAIDVVAAVLIAQTEPVAHVVDERLPRPSRVADVRLTVHLSMEVGLVKIPRLDYVAKHGMTPDFCYNLLILLSQEN